MKGFAVIGVLMINTGTADEPSEEAVRIFLRQFLSDRHLINVPPLIWRPILEHIILRKRPKNTLPRYQAFWTDEGSPFMIDSFEQGRILQEKLRKYIQEAVVVQLAMRYGNPSIEAGVESLLHQNVREILVLPLYPLWTIPCAGTVLDEFDDIYARMKQAYGDMPPAIHIREFWDVPGYFDALASSIKSRWTYKPGSKLIMSYHSVPVSYATKHGDPYPITARATLDAVGDILNIPAEDRVIAFQSRFDSRRWVGPMLGTVLEYLAHEGVRDVCVVSPIFSTECIETEYDSHRNGRDIFAKAVCSISDDAYSYTYVPALGTDDAFLESIAYACALQSAFTMPHVNTMVPPHAQDVLENAKAQVARNEPPVGVDMRSQTRGESLTGKGMGV